MKIRKVAIGREGAAVKSCQYYGTYWCGICLECTGDRTTCKEPKLSRPTADALAVDVFSTVRKLGYPIQVLSDYDQEMNRYAFLLID